MSDFYRIDSILCLVDAKHVREHLAEVKAEDAVNEAVQQVAFADRILLNKTDLVSAAELAEVKEELQSINAYAELIETQQSAVDLKRILGVSSFSVEKTLQLDPSFLDAEEGAEEEEAAADCADPHCEDDSHGHSHGGAAASAAEHGHGHGHAKKPKVEKPRKKRHDLSGVSSVGISCEGELDFNALNGFMMRLLQTNARDLFRSKGVMCFHGQGDAKFVFQGVHEQIHFGPSQSMWAAGEKRCVRGSFLFLFLCSLTRQLPPRRVNRMVFIGRKLDREALQSGFLACLHKA